MTTEYTYEKKQLFIAWLKSKGLYNLWIPATTMEAMHDVWHAAGEPTAGEPTA